MKTVSTTCKITKNGNLKHFIMDFLLF